MSINHTCHSHEHHSHHDHCHNHAHCHHRHIPSKGSKMLVVILLNVFITIVEVLGGLFSNSLSLLSDAVHNLGDTLAIVFAYIARLISNKQANLRHTFGYKRVEVLAAFINATILLSICLFLFKEAYEKWLHPEVIEGKTMLIVAIVGLIANLLSVIVLHKDKEHNINTRAAYLHLLGDTLSSVAVIAGGVAIWLYELVWLDPLITVLVSLYLMYHTWGVLHEAVNILMQTTPLSIDVNQLRKDIEDLSEVDNLHHLHVWQLDDEQIHLEAHLNTVQDYHLSELYSLHESVETLLLNKYGINHVTLQIEYNRCKGKEQLISLS